HPGSVFKAGGRVEQGEPLELRIRKTGFGSNGVITGRSARIAAPRLDHLGMDEEAPAPLLQYAHFELGRTPWNNPWMRGIGLAQPIEKPVSHRAGLPAR